MTTKENTSLVPFLLQLLNHHYFSSTAKYLKAFPLVQDSVTCHFDFHRDYWHSHSACLYSQQCSHSWHLLPSWKSLLPWLSWNHVAAPSSCVSLCAFLVLLLISPLLHVRFGFSVMLGFLLWLYTLSLSVLSIPTSSLLSRWCFLPTSLSLN